MQFHAETWVHPIATLLVAVGACLTMLPLKSVFTDWTWFATGIVAALPYWLIVGGLRRLTASQWLPLLGILASVAAIFWIFVPGHLGFGVLPTPASVRDLNDLLVLAGDQIRNDRAPVDSTHALRVITTIAFVVVVMLADVLAIALRNPLLAGAPLLEVLAVSAAISSEPAEPVAFALAATGFLLILVAGTRLQDREWGPSVDGSAGRLGGARRIAITAVVAALVIPPLLPSVSVNLLSRATHRHGEGGSAGGGGRIVLNDLASLRGSLQRTTPTELFTLQVPESVDPLYVRTNVLDVFTGDGWRPSGRHPKPPTPVTADSFPQFPALDASPESLRGSQFGAQITIRSLGGVQLPLLSTPQGLRGTPDGLWHPDTGTVELERSMTGTVRYQEDVFQLTPTTSQLRASPTWRPSGDPDELALLALPPQPAEVLRTVESVTAGLSSSYDKANAITSFFKKDSSGFVYSLDVVPDDGQSAIVAFLNNKRGFCQQFAATAAVMMRLAGIPARVVVGYNHTSPDANGVIHVTTSDAHAWVEAFFTGIGWVPFDPTPLSGIDAERSIELPWSPTPGQQQQDPEGKDQPSKSALPGESQTLPSAPTNATGSGGDRLPALTIAAGAAALLVIMLLLVGPHSVRRRQRSRRFALATERGDPEPLWQELAATAHDQGALWPHTMTVGQVPAWLAKRGVDDRGRSAIDTLARAMERRRYSASGDSAMADGTVTGVMEALRRWERRDDRKRSLLGRWLPASLRGGRRTRLR